MGKRRRISKAKETAEKRRRISRAKETAEKTPADKTPPVPEKEDTITIILPGLHDDVSLRCLARVSRLHHRNLKQVCRRWRDLLTSASSEIYSLRNSEGAKETSMLDIQVETNTKANTLQFRAREVHLSSGKIRHLSSSEEEAKVLFQRVFLSREGYQTLSYCGGQRVALLTEYPGFYPMYSLQILSGKLQIQKLPRMRALHRQKTYAVLPYNGCTRIYAAGGWHRPKPKHWRRGNKPSTVVERLDLCYDDTEKKEIQVWRRACDLPFRMWIRYSAVVSGRWLLLGSEHKSQIHRCVSYCPQSDSWKVHDNDVILQLMGSAAATAPPGSRNYKTGLIEMKYDWTKDRLSGGSAPPGSGSSNCSSSSSLLRFRCRQNTRRFCEVQSTEVSFSDGGRKVSVSGQWKSVGCIEEDLSACCNPNPNSEWNEGLFLLHRAEPSICFVSLKCSQALARLQVAEGNDEKGEAEAEAEVRVYPWLCEEEDLVVDGRSWYSMFARPFMIAPVALYM